MSENKRESMGKVFKCEIGIETPIFILVQIFWHSFDDLNHGRWDGLFKVDNKIMLWLVTWVIPIWHHEVDKPWPYK